VPVRVAGVGEFEASLINEAFPETAPIVWGVKVTVKFTLSPAVMVTGNERPLITNSELSTLTEETVTFAVVAFNVPV
jgi:hypothetical protein